jgi:hypothetical protein
VDRRTQDLLTWALAAGLLISQVTPWVPVRQDIVVGAFGLLGLPFIRKAQDAINGSREK